MRPDLTEAFGRLNFPVVALTDASWPTGGRAISYEPPTDDVYRERVGSARSVTLAFEGPDHTTPWVHVRSTRRVLSVEAEAKSALHLALTVVRYVAHHVEGTEGEPDLDTLDDAVSAPRTSPVIALDGQPTEFLALSLDGAVGAAAALPDRTIILSGHFVPDAIELQTVSDPLHYVK